MSKKEHQQTELEIWFGAIRVNFTFAKKLNNKVKMMFVWVEHRCNIDRKKQCYLDYKIKRENKSKTAW